MKEKSNYIVYLVGQTERSSSNRSTSSSTALRILGRVLLLSWRIGEATKRQRDDKRERHCLSERERVGIYEDMRPDMCEPGVRPFRLRRRRRLGINFLEFQEVCKFRVRWKIISTIRYKRFQATGTELEGILSIFNQGFVLRITWSTFWDTFVFEKSRWSSLATLTWKQSGEPHQRHHNFLPSGHVLCKYNLRQGNF